MSENELIRTAVDDGVGVITFNRPERMNALGADMRELLLASLRKMDGDPAVRAIMLTGEGRAFCAGGDVKEMNQRLDGNGPAAEPPHFTPTRDKVLALMRSMPVPIIGAINGAAVGAGMNIALGCDMRIASDRATFGEVFVRRGLHPDWGGTLFLPQLVGTAKACELIFSGRIINAEEALQLGIINRLVPHEGFHEAALAWAKEFAHGPTVAIGLAKRNIYNNMQATLEGALAAETNALAVVRATEDSAEGIRAFVEKREPAFQGR